MERLLLFADWSDVRDVSMLANGLVTGRVVIALVQAQVLRRTLGGRGAINHDGSQGGSQELRIVDIGSAYHHSQRPAVSLD